jgi:hypothetical protein
MCSAVLQEFDNEAGTTRRVLERVPTDKLSWKPHPKSMSLGELALHVAASPGVIAGWCAAGETTFSGEKAPTPSSTADILAAHDAGVKTVKETLGKLGDEGLQGTWTAKAGGNTLMSMPKSALTRDRDESLDSPPRTAIGVPAAARRGGSFDLRSKRRRKSVRGAHLIATGNTRTRGHEGDTKKIDFLGAPSRLVLVARPF